MIVCSRKQPRKNVKPSIEDQQEIPSDINYDETQDNVQTVELQEDPLANVRLLTPTLPGGCTDENAAKEAATRHKTNQYFPKLEIQSRRIVNRTSKEELRRLVEELPMHPPQRYRTEIREPALEKRVEKWKDIHVHWHDVGLVFLVRNHDTCRSKDDSGGDTVDSPNKEDEESTKINSEIPISNRTPNKSKRKTPAPVKQSSKKSLKERKLAATQEETMKSENKTPHGMTPKPPGMPSNKSGPESVKSTNI